jgi:hypothetical protein
LNFISLSSEGFFCGKNLHLGYYTKSILNFYKILVPTRRARNELAELWERGRNAPRSGSILRQDKP